MRILEHCGLNGITTVGTGIPRYEPGYASLPVDSHNIVNEVLNYNITGLRDTTDNGLHNNNGTIFFVHLVPECPHSGRPKLEAPIEGLYSTEFSAELNIVHPALVIGIYNPSGKLLNFNEHPPTENC